jgi:integrase
MANAAPFQLPTYEQLLRPGSNFRVSTDWTLCTPSRARAARLCLGIHKMRSRADTTGLHVFLRLYGTTVGTVVSTWPNGAETRPLAPKSITIAVWTSDNNKGGRYYEFPDGTWYRVLKRATELAREIDPEARTIKGGPHTARHTFASFFLKAKPDLFLLGRIMGHGTAKLTELYAHLVPDHLAEGRNLVTFDVATRPGDPASRQG